MVYLILCYCKTNRFLCSIAFVRVIFKKKRISSIFFISEPFSIDLKIVSERSALRPYTASSVCTLSSVWMDDFRNVFPGYEQS